MSKRDTLKKLKSFLDGVVQEQAKAKAEEGENNEAINTALLLSGMSDISEAIKEAQATKEEMLTALATFKVESPVVNVPEVKLPTITIPEIKIPEINVPVPQVTVNVPKIELPVINVPEPKITVNVEKSDPPIIPPFPEIKMPDQMMVMGEVSLKDINPKNPLPVQVFGDFPMASGGGGSKMGSSKTLDGAGNKITSTSGALDVNIAGGNVTLQASDIEIGAVELKNGTDDTRATITAANALKVDGSAVTQPISAGATLDVIQVSGSNWSTSASQVGTWTVQPGNTQNTTPWRVESGFSFVNVTGANSSTVVKTGSGVVHTVTINTRGTGSTVALYDDIAGVGNKIATIDTTLSTTAFLYDVIFTNGLTAVTVGASGADLTISYR